MYACRRTWGPIVLARRGESSGSRPPAGPSTAHVSLVQSGTLLAFGGRPRVCPRTVIVQDALPPGRSKSTSSVLLPSPIRRVREHLREIRRVAGETQQQVIVFGEELSRMSARLDQLVAARSAVEERSREAVPVLGPRHRQAAKSFQGAPSARTLLDSQGTDKGWWYGGLYDVLLQPVRTTIRCVVEIGIGTMIPDAASSMVGIGASHYRTGASLRAWRDFLPNAEIHGIDPAEDTSLAEEARIHTHRCDSTDPEQVSALLASVTWPPPDLIIDDGLHDPTAQAKTLHNFFPVLRDGGLYIIEDVSQDHVHHLLDELDAIQEGCHSFVDRSWGTLVAIVIRRPARV
jgi:hypothetical protein